jgi:hypothetical protein
LLGYFCSTISSFLLQMLFFITRFKSLQRLGSLLLAGALPLLAQGQCACTQTVTESPTYQSVLTVSSGTLCIGAGVNWQNATIRVTGNDVTICNQGTLGDNYSSNGYGVVEVAAGLHGVVINNLGTVNSQTMKLHSAVVLHNGSSNGGATRVATATWQGSLANTCDVAPAIANYASWQAEVHALPGGTITNAKGATWSGYLTTMADLRITNAGTWSSQVQEAGSSPTITIVHNGGVWSGGVGGGNGSLRITNNANWTVGFNFPNGANNMFTTAAGATSSYNAYLGLGGQVTLTNKGTMTLSGGMGTLGRSSSLTMAASSKLDLMGDFSNDGTVINAGTIAASGNFFNNGTITGADAPTRGRFTAGSYTFNNGSFGADGSYLDFCDAGAPSTGFDATYGTIGRNVTYCASSNNLAGSPLPVTLVSFTAQARSGQVLLGWATASEQANAGFELERSADGQRFTLVQTLPGHGTTAHAQTYSYLDAQPLPGRSYYRLRQLDLGGASTYSPVVSVQLAELAVVAPLAYPTPTTGSLQLDLRPYAAEVCEVRVLNTLGQLVQQARVLGGQVQTLGLGQLPAGTYLLSLSQGDQRPTLQRIVKQ